MIYKVKNKKELIRGKEDGEKFKSYDLDRLDSSGIYTDKREITNRFSLKEGAYVVIPSCYDEGAEGEFLLRIFTEKPLNKM